MNLDSSDREDCVRCRNKNDGHVLVCSEIDCQIAIHENCMGCKPNFDEVGSFYCPHCSFKRALESTRILKRNARTAKIGFLVFLGDKYHQKDGEDEKKNEDGSEEVLVDRSEFEPNTNARVEKGTIMDDLVNGLGVNEGVVDGIRVSPSREHEDERVVDKPTRIKRMPPRTVENANSSKHSSKMENDEEPPRSKLKLPTTKRKRIYWTTEEEEMLKEGVAHFSTSNTQIPWQIILKYGCHMFRKTGTPVDLKDKWRKIKD